MEVQEARHRDAGVGDALVHVAADEVLDAGPAEVRGRQAQAVGAEEEVLQLRAGLLEGFNSEVACVIKCSDIV